MWLVCEELVKRVIASFQKRGIAVPLSTEFDIVQLLNSKKKTPVWEARVLVYDRNNQECTLLKYFEGEKFQLPLYFQ